MSIKRSELRKYKADWPYTCVVKKITPELWTWCDIEIIANGGRYMWDYVFDDDGELSPDTWFAFKDKDDWIRFTLTWS